MIAIQKNGKNGKTRKENEEKKITEKTCRSKPERNNDRKLRL